jgi:hypothetical protein
VVGELTPDEALEQRLITADEAQCMKRARAILEESPSPNPQPVETTAASRGSNGAKANDPIAALTPKQLFVECIWESPESTVTKAMLLCIARFLDDDAKSSSMSFAQVARNCTFHEGTAKKIAVRVRGRWLEIEPGKGYYVPGKGAQNLYHGICPVEVVEALRERLSEVAQEYPEANGEDRGRPGLPRNGISGSPRILAGSPRTTRTSLSLNNSGADADATHPPTPHLTADGFIISERRGLVIPAATVMQWRERFPDIPDLEAAMQGLATLMLSKGPMHPGWTCPEGWMVKPLAEMNAEAADKRKVTAARVARANNNGGGGGVQPRGKSRRSELDKL